MNEEEDKRENKPYDLEERLLEYAARVIRLTQGMGNTSAERHIAGQLLRSGTSPLGNHGEAQASESTADFVHKFKLCLKELRESKRWLRLIHRVPLHHDLEEVMSLIQETDELERIFNSSILTAKRRK